MQKIGVPINSNATAGLVQITQHKMVLTNLGTLCRGHGMSPKSCGHDRMKLNICGRKNNRRVFEKWAWIPTTAKAIPVA